MVNILNKILLFCDTIKFCKIFTKKILTPVSQAILKPRNHAGCRMGCRFESYLFLIMQKNLIFQPVPTEIRPVRELSRHIHNRLSNMQNNVQDVPNELQDIPNLFPEVPDELLDVPYEIADIHNEVLYVQNLDLDIQQELTDMSNKALHV